MMDTKTVYLHDENGYFTQPYDCEKQPRGGGYIEPTSSLALKPSILKNKWPKAVGGQWVNVADYRDFTYWLDDGSEHTIEELEISPPKGYLTSPPPPALEEVKNSALAKIQSFSDAAVLSMTKSPTQVEVDTWPLKMITAEAIINGTQVLSAGEAYLRSFNLTTDEERKAWADKVQAKATAYATVAGVADFLKDGAKQAVLAANTSDEVEAALSDAEQKANDAIEALKAAE